jgi:predicted phosphodiesterase
VIRTFGAIGDIHAEDRFLAAALDHLRGAGVDAVLSVGDIADGRGDLERCVRLLRERDVLAVRGNHERWLLDGKLRELPRAHLAKDLARSTLDWLSSLPPTRTLDTIAGRLLLCHAVGDDDMIRLLPDDEPPVLALNDPLQRVLGSGVELMVCGHTHRPMVRTIFGLTVINAGTLVRDDDPGFVRVDLERRLVQFFEFEEVDGEPRVVPGEPIRFGGPGDDVWGAGW